MYQIVVISHVTKPKALKSSWNRIEQLQDFSILTSLVPGIPPIQNFTQNEFNETIWAGDLGYRMIVITNPNARLKSLTLYRKSIFYNASKLAFIARSYSDFGSAAWNKLGPECLMYFKMGGCNGWLNEIGVSHKSRNIILKIIVACLIDFCFFYSATNRLQSPSAEAKKRFY